MHYGGTMTEGKNNEIYFVIGDLRFSETHNGGIFQNMISSDNITESGSIFKIDTENNNVELYAMGIRNSFGLAVDPVTGHLWDTENGITKYDEINLVKQRFNSGWEVVMGPADRNYSVTGENLMIDNVMVSRSSYTKVTNPSFENFEYSDPEFSWYKPVGPTAIAFQTRIVLENTQIGYLLATLTTE